VVQVFEGGGVLTEMIQVEEEISWEKFEKDIYMKIWNWHELSESDIETCSQENNLTDYNREIFESVVWVCKKKN
jgi:hypothetical protein